MSTEPRRIQRRRTKGWRKPEGAVYVGRGSRWGNPFVVGGRYMNRSSFHQAPYPTHENDPLGATEHPPAFGGPGWSQTIAVVRDQAHAVELFRAHVDYEDLDWNPAEIRAELAGKDLMCWCPEGSPCHADVLLEIANR